MLRWMILAVLVVALTAAATVFVQLLPPTTTGSGPAIPHVEEVELSGPPGHAVVEGGEMTYEFGTMDAHGKADHEWVVRNEGEGDLILRLGETSCSCTVANLGKGDEMVLKPGESTTVRLEWHTNKLTDGPYSQTSKILTINDPNQQMLEFGVKGTVAPAVVIDPPGEVIALSSFPSDEGASSHLAIYAPARDDLEITTLTTSKPDLMEATYQPLSPEQCELLKVKSGYRVDLDVKPGMPLGDVSEELLIRTNHPLRPEVRLTIAGRSVGPITVIPDTVRISTSTRDRGTKASVVLWVRGAESTRFEVAEAPPKLKVEVEPADDTTGTTANARRYRLTVSVPSGIPPGLINGEIVLKTDHPQAAEVRVPVRVKVLASG